MDFIENFLDNYLEKLEHMSTLKTVAVATTGFVSLISAYHVYLSIRMPGEAKVEWSWFPIMGHAIAFGAQPVKAIQKLSQDSKGKTKEIVGLVLAGKRVFLINDPLSFKVVFKSRNELSFDEFSRTVLINVFGATPECTHGIHVEAEPLSRVQYQKHLLQDEGCTAITDRMQLKLAAMVQAIGSGVCVLDMQEFMNRLIFRASAAALFNNALADDEELFQRFIDFDDMFALAVAGLPVKLLSTGYRGREKLLSEITRFKDDLSQFIQSRYKLLAEDFGYGCRDLSANHLSMLWASVGNTMPATFWTMLYILRSPEALDAVNRELIQVLGESRAHDPDLLISADELRRMEVLDSCISEALRLSSGSLIMRKVTQACTLTLSSGNTYSFRKGDSVGVFPPLAHHDADIYPDPEEFRYDRFVGHPSTLTIDGKEVASSLCFIPFGGGVSYCPGRKFARNEIKALAAQLLLRFNIEFMRPTSSENSRDPYVPPIPDVDYSRAGLGVFQPKDCHIKISLSKKH
mmetsp:Transcript_16611/g.25002  ORF Transcript_16611/g.25002 Transcript_16611/m.25002 type:complete len:518 (-) Transcript_16611:185-1738(-)|eukprot:CAMPEP_0185028604 /NCGR_PEP_ID=MMETSP1103-20130426/14415_1 /TAXON_ID=36769 /ORGANISM="Paraphysomonas bandaiensis, Strain Caron Lab Isolate" /LENGTH=517 /DNA_ID=CAMNT_0027563069 /DNA_START=28 /DNA_END=1581 /DNA_ORIENTATION=+